MAGFEEYLRNEMIQRGVVLDDGSGRKYRFDGHEPRHGDMSFCLENITTGDIIQVPYDKVRRWEVVENR